MNKIRNMLAKTRLRITNQETYYIDEEEFDLITDEIEKSLLEIKEAYDIPTSEIERSVISRRESKNRRKKTSR